MSKPFRNFSRPLRKYIASKIASPEGDEREKEKAARAHLRYKERLASIHSCDRLLAVAEGAAAANNHYEAVRALRLALLRDPDQTRAFCRQHSLAAIRQDALIAEAGPGFKEKPRLFHLFRECALLGHFEGKLTTGQREILKRVIEVNQEQWETKRTPQPRHSGNVEEMQKLPAPAPGRVAIVMPRYVLGSSKYLDHDIGYYFQMSLQNEGVSVDYFEADRLVYPGASQTPDEVEKLDAFLTAKKPAFVIFDGNFVPMEKTITPEQLKALKAKHKFSFINVIGDWYDFMANDYFACWSRVADLTVAFHRYSLHYDSAPVEKVMIWPTVPFPKSALRGIDPRERDLGLTYIGSNTRDRGLMMELATRSNIPTCVHIHNRKRDEAPNQKEMAQIFGRSRIILNNGWLENGEDILTARVGEAVLSGALLLQEVGTPLEDYLVPFVHYAPFTNLHQFVALAQFFLENDDLRFRIVKQAFEFWDDHYSSSLFWKTLFRHFK